jgi:cysteinyl-tRNA synthetase
LDVAASEAMQAHLGLLKELAGVVGLRHEAGALESSTNEGLDDGAIAALIDERKAAKAVRDFATADRIRDQLRGQGIELIDRPGGTTERLRR